MNALLRDQAGTYPSRITSSPIRSLASRRSGGRGPAKIGRAASKHDGVQVEPIHIDQAELGQASRQSRPATSISPSSSAFRPRTAALDVTSTSVALGPTDFNVRDTTHFRWPRHAVANSRSSAPHSGCLVPVAHHFVHPAAVDAARLAAAWSMK